MAISPCPSTSPLPFLLMTLLLDISDSIFADNLSPTLATEHLATFTCTSLGFYSHQVSITWFENGKESHPQKKSLSSSQINNFYNITRMVQLPFSDSHVQSHVVCEVKPESFTGDHTLKPQRDAVNNSLSSRGSLTTATPGPFPAKKTQPYTLLLTLVFLGWKILLLMVLFAFYIIRRRLM